jgi:hypothetical protein
MNTAIFAVPKNFAASWQNSPNSNWPEPSTREFTLCTGKKMVHFIEVKLYFETKSRSSLPSASISSMTSFSAIAFN